MLCNREREKPDPEEGGDSLILHGITSGLVDRSSVPIVLFHDSLNSLKAPDVYQHNRVVNALFETQDRIIAPIAAVEN